MQLKQFLKLKNLSQREFSFISGISQPQVSKIMQGKTRSISAMVALRVQVATSLSVTAYDLIGLNKSKLISRQIEKRMNSKTKD